ncbi:hypothetical protein E3N88_13867 [Mikania micrantha]|uniref:Uncharacterized protein n=1 Tax=Mikania micrantha TaxID=192012 RepID=A0A5N6P117_9ASTR|nr:hypothetical protein E3N88_13867 [Mikania micrantha]
MPYLIGVDDNIQLISSWLKIGSHHSADIITLVGESGIGKTSLAKYVFQLHSSQFHRVSFIEGINTRCNEHFNGLFDLQKQLHEDISKKILLHANDALVYTSKIENVLANKRVFIVLDDIGSLKQLDALLGKKGIHPRAKIIITTKDASLTERCALFKIKVKPKHKKVLLNGLYKSESLELFCIHAFKNHKPKEGYKEVSEKLVKYCEGNPLALKVLGRSLQKQDIRCWKECIKLLKKEPHSRINKALKISFDVFLLENYKELFKHIACFFVGNDRDATETILNACDIETRSGIKILIDRCLLSLSQENRLMMHQLVQEMGRELVRQESPKKPWKRSRLCCHAESFKVLKLKKDKGNLLGLALDTRMLDKKKSHGSFELNTESFVQMDNLMLLQLNYVQLNGRFKNFPEELRWLSMRGSRLKSIHLDLPMENLVVLDMSYSSMEFFNPQPPAKRQKQLVGSCIKDKPLLGSLKILDLSFCDHLLSLGGFVELPALEKLIVRGCKSLTDLCESVGHCVELVHIDLSYCHMLRMLPKSMGKLKKNPPRYAMHVKYLRFLRISSRYAKPFWASGRAMADRGEQYQLAPHDMRDGTPSSSSAPDSDSSEASTAASRAPSVVPQAQPALPHLPLEPRPATPPPAALPIIPSPPHLPPVDPVADRIQSISPPRVPVWDGLRRMRSQARKTTGLPPRKQLAPRDEFHARHEMGESSHQAELRAQLQQVTQNLQGTQQSLQQCQATVEDTRRTILDILTSHLTLMDQVKALDTDTRAWRTAMDDRLRMSWGQIMLAAFWRQVAWMTEGWSWVRERVTEYLAWFGVMSTETRMMILAVVMAIVAMILSFLSYFMR